MADDNGRIADIESAIVTLLEAVQLSSEDVFKTVDHWKFQIVSSDAFKRYSPFAFVRYVATPQTFPEGDHDLRQAMYFHILIGTEHHSDGESRIGLGTDAGDYELGISRIRDLVVTAMQEVHPTLTDDKADYFEFLGDAIVWEEPKRCALEMRFRLDITSDYT